MFSFIHQTLIVLEVNHVNLTSLQAGDAPICFHESRGLIYQIKKLRKFEVSNNTLPGIFYTLMFYTLIVKYFHSPL